MAKKNYSNEPYIFKTFQAFAIAYFATYILGNILLKIGELVHMETLVEWGNHVSVLLGPAIGIAIAYKSGVGLLGLISSMIAGAMIMPTSVVNHQVALPLITYLTVIIVVLCIRMVENKTPLDLFLIPLLALLISGVIKIWISPYVISMISYIISFINELTVSNEIVMGMLIALISGLIYCTPITLVAITSLLSFNLLASGAMLAGAMSFIIGLGLMSLQDNDIGDSLAVMIGTPVLQFSNLVKRPLLLIPPIISSLVCGVLSVCVFKIPCSLIGASQGGTALIGLLEATNIMGMQYWIIVVLSDLIIPIVINFSIYQLFRKARYIKNGDLKILK